MQNVTEMADVGASASEQQLTREASDAWQITSVIAHQGYVTEFATETKMTNGKAGYFAGEISKCPGLKNLSISGNDPGFLREFAEGLGVCPELEFLDLSKNNIGVSDIHSLLRVIQQCPNLARLTLLDNPVGPEAFETLQKRLKDAKCPSASASGNGRSTKETSDVS